VTTRRIFGFVLFAVGVIVFIMGKNASESFADQLTKTFTGRFTDRTSWYIIGGTAAGLLGLGLVLFGGRRSRA
jgi:hypothetical protein